MTYPALPSARRMHYEIDGTVVGYNITNFATGMTTVLNAAQMLQLNEETPSVNAAVLTHVAGSTDFFVYFIFPELVDLSDFICRITDMPGYSLTNLAGSPDTTTGVDGTWTAIGLGAGSTMNHSAAADDWWRSSTPAALVASNTSLKAVRFQATGSGGGGGSITNLRNVYLWGSKHAGQTVDDILFLESDGATEEPQDDDWGDIPSGGATVTHTYYVKNASGTKTANATTVKVSGSDSAKFTVSLDNATFAASKSIASLAPGTTQVIYVKFATPAPAGGVYRPYAAYLEADVTSWT